MKKLILFGAAISISVAVSAQHVALKNNLLYDATTTLNLALEVALSLFRRASDLVRMP